MLAQSTQSWCHNKYILIHVSCLVFLLLPFCCMEMWHTDSIYSNKIIATNSCIYRKDRISRGGGVLIAVSNSIASADVGSLNELEMVTVAAGSRNVVLICTVYIHHSSQTSPTPQQFTNLSLLSPQQAIW